MPLTGETPLSIRAAQSVPPSQRTVVGYVVAETPVQPPHFWLYDVSPGGIPSQLPCVAYVLSGVSGLGRAVGCFLSPKPRLAPVRQRLRSGETPKNPAQQMR